MDMAELVLGAEAANFMDLAVEAEDQVEFPLPDQQVPVLVPGLHALPVADFVQTIRPRVFSVISHRVDAFETYFRVVYVGNRDSEWVPSADLIDQTPVLSAYYLAHPEFQLEVFSVLSIQIVDNVTYFHVNFVRFHPEFVVNATSNVVGLQSAIDKLFQ
jgi:hypothetical protein